MGKRLTPIKKPGKQYVSSGGEKLKYVCPQPAPKEKSVMKEVTDQTSLMSSSSSLGESAHDSDSTGRRAAGSTGESVYAMSQYSSSNTAGNDEEDETLDDLGEGDGRRAAS